MSDRARFVNRWAKLSRNFRLEKHRQANVEVISYDPVDELYEVKLCSTGTRESISVQSSELKFYPDFGYYFPNAPIIKWSPSMHQLPFDTVIDLSVEREVHLCEPDEVLRIISSCRLVGGLTRICSSVGIEFENRDVRIVEMENIIFEQTADARDGKQKVICRRGRVVFRSCRFIGNQIGVMVGAVEVERTEVWVTFENCSFMFNKECGVRVESGRASFVNCNFDGSGIGIAAGDGADLDVVGCSFVNCIGGVLLPYAATCTISHSTFERLDYYGILASNGSHVRINESAIKLCTGHGIVVEGGYETNCHARDSQIDKCGIAIRVGNGRVNVTLKAIDINDCIVGIYAAIDAVGSIEGDECFSGTSEKGIVHLTGDNCKVVFDGANLHSQYYGTLMQRLESFQASFARSSVKYGYPISAFGKLMLHKAGIAIVNCTHCKVSAAADQWFKKCGNCREVRYCSRACQVAHYSTHRVECIVTATKARLMSIRGYIHCNECGTVGSETAGNGHSACSRCLGVFYCSRQCQVTNWKEHKQECTPCTNSKTKA